MSQVQHHDQPQPRGLHSWPGILRRLGGATMVLGLVAACASIPELDDGKRLIAEGRLDEGLAKLELAARKHPQNADVRNNYVMQREAIVGAFVRDGDALRLVGDFDTAESRFRRALAFDPSSSIVRAGLDAIVRDRRLAAVANDAEQALKRGDYATAETLARNVLAENSSQRTARSVMRAVAERKASLSAEPALKVDPQLKVTLEFRDAPLQSVFELISRRSGINFVFDREVRPDLRTSIVAREQGLEDLIRLLLITNQLERKVISESAVLIYPNTPAKKREYQEMVVRTFYLANADPKQTAAMIRTVIKTRDLFVDDKLNLIVMKDTAEAVRLAEQLVATQDLGEPEVMLDLEVLEVASSVVQEFGIRYPERVNFGILNTEPQPSIDVNGNVTTVTQTSGTVPDFVEVRPRQWRGFVANPALVLNLRKLDGTASLLANPRIRVKNRDKAKVHIGEKVPVITTTSTANVGVSSSVSYLETGLKLDVEPNVFLEDEVAIKVQLEVSNILEQLNVGGTVSYRLGTRNAATTLRLKDGETQVLAGLINSEDRKSANKVPYLGDVPLLGRLFRSDNDQRTKTEIVLLITPHIVRNLARPDSVSAQFSSGTEAAPGAPPLRLARSAPQALGLSGGNTGAVTAATPAPAPRRPGAATDQGAAAASVALLVSGPQQASAGQEFALSLRFGADVQQSANAYVDLSYDPAVLALAGGAAPTPGAGADAGRTRVNVVTQGIGGVEPRPVEVRFRVIAKERTSSEIGIQVGSAIDFSGQPVRVVAPPAHNIEIVP
jgi:general secretion pathway protein D